MSQILDRITNSQTSGLDTELELKDKVEEKKEEEFEKAPATESLSHQASHVVQSLRTPLSTVSRALCAS